MIDLTVSDAASLLRVSEKTIYRWIQKRVIPAYKIGGHYRFRRNELLSWAGARRVVVTPGSLAAEDVEENVSLFDALKVGGIHAHVKGATKSESLANITAILDFPPQVNRDYVLAELLAREDLGSTGVGDGIAIPHIRTPITPDLPHPLAALCFLQNPVDFMALDGAPVTAVFVLLSPSVRTHLRLMSLLAFCLRNRDVHKAIKDQAQPQQILQAVRQVEKQLFSEQHEAGDAAATA